MTRDRDAAQEITRRAFLCSAGAPAALSLAMGATAGRSDAAVQPDAGRIDSSPERLRLGALVLMRQAEDHPAVRTDYPVIRDALALASSRQIRNVASLGGNVL